MLKEAKETSVVQTLKERLFSTDSVELPMEFLPLTIKVIIMGYTKFLGNAKNAGNSSAIIINDTNGKFVASIVLEKIQDDEGKGSFEVHFELDEEALNEIDSDCKYEFSTIDVALFVNNFGYKEFGAQFTGTEIVIKTLRRFFVVMIGYLNNIDKSEMDDEGLTINFEDTILCEVTEEDGKREIAFEAGTELKKFIKDDKFIEVE